MSTTTKHTDDTPVMIDGELEARELLQREGSHD